jgi:hypothetical protein
VVAVLDLDGLREANKRHAAAPLTCAIGIADTIVRRPVPTMPELGSARF